MKLPALRYRHLYWYGLVACTAILAGTLYVVYSQRAVESARSHNVARVQTLKSDIARLPAVSSIAPGKTSGQLDYVASSRQALADKALASYYPKRALWLWGLNARYIGANSAITEHRKVVESTRETLTATAHQLASLKKLIEYMPSTDLAGDLSADPLLAKRLEATQKGIDAARSYVQASPLTGRDAIAAKLAALSKKAPSLTNADLPQWSSDVLDIQKVLLKAIAERDIQQTEYLENYDAVVRAYQ